MNVLYCMMCFSPFVPDLRARHAFGYVCCFIVSTHLLVNLLLITISTAQELKVRLRIWLAKRKLQQQRIKNAVKIKSRNHILREAIYNFSIYSFEDSSQLNSGSENDSDDSDLEIIVEEEGDSSSS